MRRPDGNVVAPLPGAVHDRSLGVGLVAVDVTDESGRTRASCVLGVVAVVTWDQAGEWEGMGSADAEHLIRVLHDAGQLDAYRERCEAAAWRRFDREDRATWPTAEKRYLIVTPGGFVALGGWLESWSTWMVKGCEVRNVTHWRPLPVGPVQP